MQTYRDVLRRCARLFGALFLVAGLMSTAHLWWAYHAQARVFSKDLIYTPLMVLYGLGVLIEPNLFRIWFADENHPVPGHFKGWAIALTVIGGCIGLLLATGVFGDWERATLGS